MYADMSTVLHLLFYEVRDMAKNNSGINKESIEKPSYELSSSMPLS